MRTLAGYLVLYDRTNNTLTDSSCLIVIVPARQLLTMGTEAVTREYLYSSDV